MKKHLSILIFLLLLLVFCQFYFFPFVPTVKASPSAGSGFNFFTDVIDKTPTTTGAWVDIDVSGDGVPTGSTGVILKIVNTGAGFSRGTVRKNGSTDNFLTYLSAYHGRYAFVGVDANRIFEAYISVTAVKIYLAGYTDENCGFFDNAVDKTPTTTGSWVDRDASADILSGSTGVICLLYNSVGTASYSGGIRKNGSTDEYPYGLCLVYCFDYQLCGVDANRIFEAKIQDTAFKVELVGYTKLPVTFFTNGIDKSLTSTSTWTDIDVTADTSTTADGAIILIKNTHTTTLYTGDVRKNGGTDDHTGSMRLTYTGCQAAAVGMDSDQIFEGWIDNVAVDFYLIGYCKPAVAPTYSNIGVNTTVAGQSCLFSVLWNDQVNVSGFIHSSNNSGSWLNQSWVAFSVFYNSTAAWSNATLTLNSTVGVVVQWIIYCNNTNNFWNNTGIISLHTATIELQPSPQSQLSVGQIHGLIYYNGYLYGCSQLTPGKVIKIASNNYSDTTVVTITRDTTNASALRDIIEEGDFLYTIDDNAYIYKLYPGNLSTANYKQLIPSAFSIGQALCSDGTYVYGSGTDAWVAKIEIATWTSSSNQLATGKIFNSICQDGDYIYVGDMTDKIFRKVSKSTLQQVSASASTGLGVSDDVAQDDTYIYGASESGSKGVIRVTKSSMDRTVFSFSGFGYSYGSFNVQASLLCLDYQNQELWIFNIPAVTLKRIVRLVNLSYSGGINEFAAEGTNYVHITQWYNPASLLRLPYMDVIGPAYALNLRVMDWDLTDAIPGAYVYIKNDTASYIQTSNANGWANWTGISGTVYINVSYYSFWVNGTFSLNVASDMTINVKCNLYDVHVQILPANQQGILYMANVTVFNATSIEGNKICTALSNETGYAYLANLPNNTLTFTVYTTKLDTLTVNPTADSYISELYPKNNYGTSTTLRVSGETVSSRTFLNFSFSLPSDASVTEAKIRLYAYSVLSDTTHNISRVVDSWTEASVTWENQPSVTSSNSIQQAIDVTAGWKEYDITNMFKDALSLGYSNISVRIHDIHEGSMIEYDTYFYSREASSNNPTLVITYEIPIVLANVSRSITSDEQTLTPIICDQNYGNLNIPWEIIIIPVSLILNTKKYKKQTKK